MKPIAIVTPWFGKNLKGGAEQHAWQLATRFSKQGHEVDVLTTCCKSFLDDWATNHYKEGLSHEKGIHIRRFRVDRRNKLLFESANRHLLDVHHSDLKPGKKPVNKKLSKIFVDENINSENLLKFISKTYQHYHAFIFIPYLYGPILKGLPLVADKAILNPCLHDESYAYIEEVENVFRLAKRITFLSEGEMVLAQKLYGPGVYSKSRFTGAGVEIDKHCKSQVKKVNSFQISQKKYILCLGRRDSRKNTDFLVESYARFRKQYPGSELVMVLAGPGDHSYNGWCEGVFDFGLVSEQEKESLLDNCLALFHPSHNESFSRVIMEAWFKRKAVVAHRDCLATATAVLKAKGGWVAGSEDEWTNMFEKMDREVTDNLLEFGEKGYKYVEQNARWDKVIDRYERVLFSDNQKPKMMNKNRIVKTIHQLLPNIEYGDAISNHAFCIRDYLRSSGYKSEIYANAIGKMVKDEAILFRPKLISNNDGLIYHHSIGSEITKHAIKHSGPKCLIYHNITPSFYFKKFRPDFAKILDQARIDLRMLAEKFSISAGDSEYNISELLENKFNKPSVLPIVVDPGRWAEPADSKLMERMQDGKANLLFVGRFAPNKCQNHLVEAFAQYLTMDMDARLILVGGSTPGDPYYDHLIRVIKKTGLINHVILADHVNDSELQAYYRTADLFWSMSEHEGFGVPLVEAMWFNIPILAYKSSAVPETLGKSGIMFTNKSDPASVAALAKLIVRDSKLRMTVLKAQEKRRVDFLPEAVLPKLDLIVEKMEAGIK